MMTLPHTFRMTLGSVGEDGWCCLAGLAPPGGESRLRESLQSNEREIQLLSHFLRVSAFPNRFPDILDVSVRRLVSATRMTQAGWKLRPGMRLASRERTLVKLTEVSGRAVD